MLQAWSTALGALVLVASPQVATWRLTAADAAAPVLQMPALPGSTKQANGTPLHQPRFEGSKVEASAVYGEGPDAVTVHVAYYRQQTYGHKLVNSENMLVISEDPVWRRSAAGNTEIVVGARRQPLRTAELRSGNVGAISGAQRLQVRQLYWVGGRWTTSDHLAALLGVAGQLSGRGDDGAALTFYIAGDDVDHANQALDRFVARHLDDVGRWLAGVQAAR